MTNKSSGLHNVIHNPFVSNKNQASSGFEYLHSEDLRKRELVNNLNEEDMVEMITEEDRDLDHEFLRNQNVKRSP
jgi:hypothetical protein